MIYLIGGPPRSGKTTLAKRMSKKYRIPWISCDTLGAIEREHTPKSEWDKKYPYSYLRKDPKMGRSNDLFYETYSPKKIASVLKKQAKSTYKAIDIFIACEIADGNDYIVEGYHITPQFADKMIKKYGKKNIKAMFLGKFDEYQFAKDVHKSTTPNDWLIVLTKKQETFVRVGKMVSFYSQEMKEQAKKYGLKMFNMDKGFNKQIISAIKYLIK